MDEHSGIILSMVKSNDYLITGSSDCSVKVSVKSTCFSIALFKCIVFVDLEFAFIY